MTTAPDLLVHVPTSCGSICAAAPVAKSTSISVSACTMTPLTAEATIICEESKCLRRGRTDDIQKLASDVQMSRQKQTQNRAISPRDNLHDISPEREEERKCGLVFLYIQCKKAPFRGSAPDRHQRRRKGVGAGWGEQQTGGVCASANARHGLAPEALLSTA